MKLKKVLVAGLALTMALGVLTGCGGDNKEEAKGVTGDISVISREEGSGTRGAFIELFGIETKDENGEKIDNTLSSAEITNSTSVMMQTIEGNENAIGYVSLGTLSDTVKALKIDGVEATAENVKSGDYKISRPFNIVTTENTTEQAQDFIKFIMSEEGQKVVEEEGYISQGNEGAFDGGKVTGKLTIAGSSSVTPLMEKLKEAYNKINADLNIEVQQSDSSTGVSSALEGAADIGMASRELKDEEISKGAKGTAIALDGIAVIVNKANAIEDITSEMVQKIYTGEITKWEDIK